MPNIDNSFSFRYTKFLKFMLLFAQFTFAKCIADIIGSKKHLLFDIFCWGLKMYPQIVIQVKFLVAAFFYQNAASNTNGAETIVNVCSTFITGTVNDISDDLSYYVNCTFTKVR